MSGTNYLEQSGQIPVPKYATVEIGEAKKGETKVRRSFCSPDKLVETPVEGVTTMAEVLEYAVKSESRAQPPRFASHFGFEASWAREERRGEEAGEGWAARVCGVRRGACWVALEGGPLG